MTGKKRIIIGIAVLLILLILLLCIRKPIFSNSVDKIVLKTYSHSYTPGNTEVVLNPEEVQKVILLYNLRGIGGEITSEPCCDIYWLEICFTDGTQIRISECNDKDQLHVEPVSGERYCTHSRALVSFILELIEQYDMVCD